MSLAPVFPPLLEGRAAGSGEDPFAVACAAAAAGCDAGLLVHDLAPDRLRAALVFAPEVTLDDAMAMLPLCGVGLQNALGVLAPPEVAVQLEWNGTIRVNGGRCGRLRAAAHPADPAGVPDWLVVGFEVQFWPQSDTPGETPDDTSLHAEGCGEVEPRELLEAFARHTLVQVNRWDDEGAGPLHRDWIGLVHGRGAEIVQSGQTGTFTGTDERFGLLLKSGGRTCLIPLTDLLETP